jgi:O-antigen/teichoic acid export membrane protein
MLISMIVSLYTSRVVLNTLGVSDFGIYGVVGAVVGLLTFLNASMSGATSRFLTFELGKGDDNKLKDVFATALIIHCGIALVIIIIAETLGLWLLMQKLVIPESRMAAAQWVYQFSILSMAISVTQVPYNASIIAHEKMDVYAYIEILNVVLKLVIVYLLVIGNFDKLILYAFLVLAVSTFIALLYRFYCIRKFKECHFAWVIRPSILKPMLTFSGWDLYGNMSDVARGQGVNMLLNVFFGTVANAACGIATQVQGVIMAFAGNISTAVRPQIIKSYASGDYNAMLKLIYVSAKYVFLMLLFISLPVLLETHFILLIWLNKVPEYTIWFTRYSILFNYYAAISYIIAAGIHATGKIKRISLINGTLYLLVLPFSYFAFRLSANINTPFVFNVLAVIIGCLLNIYTLKLYVKQASYFDFIYKVFVPTILIAVASGLIALYVQSFFAEGWLRFIMICIVSSLTILFMTYFSAGREMRKKIDNKLRIRLIHG